MTRKNIVSPILVWSFTIFIGITALILIWMAAFSGSLAQAAPPAQIPIYTPTPGPDGRIIYIVKEGDNLTTISIISGLTIEKIKELNNLTDDNIVAGQKLLLGLAGPAEVTITPGPTPTPTALLPSPSPKPGLGTLCILLYNDMNGDSIRQEEEPSIPDGAISVRNSSAFVNLTQTTLAGTDPFCFEDIAEGEYTISVAIPPGYNPTTETNYILKLNPGDSSYLDFGAQATIEKQEESQTIPSNPGTRRSPLLGIIGAIFLIGAIVLALFARRFFK
jgi:LysM repeat protein